MVESGVPQLFPHHIHEGLGVREHQRLRQEDYAYSIGLTETANPSALGHDDQ